METGKTELNLRAIKFVKDREEDVVENMNPFFFECKIRVFGKLRSNRWLKFMRNLIR